MSAFSYGQPAPTGSQRAPARATPSKRERGDAELTSDPRSTGVPSGTEPPLLVSSTRAKRLLDVGNTTFWKLVKTGKIQMADLGGRRMVIYASLEALTKPPD